MASFVTRLELAAQLLITYAAEHYENIWVVGFAVESRDYALYVLWNLILAIIVVCFAAYSFFVCNFVGIYFVLNF